jgi:hypothetical protein
MALDERTGRLVSLCAVCGREPMPVDNHDSSVWFECLGCGQQGPAVDDRAKAIDLWNWAQSGLRFGIEAEGERFARATKDRP